MKTEILVISDDILGYGNYRNILEQRDFKIEFKCSISEAIKHISNDKKIRMIIIDFDIPVFRKQDLKTIKPLFKIGTNNIILVVKEINDNTLNECIDKYQINVIKKPFEIDDLLSDVEVVLNT